MNEKSTKPTLEQITDKMEELEVDQQQSNEDLDEETLAMKAMGLPISFTSSIVSLLSCLIKN